MKFFGKNLVIWIYSLNSKNRDFRICWRTDKKMDGTIQTDKKIFGFFVTHVPASITLTVRYGWKCTKYWPLSGGGGKSNWSSFFLGQTEKNQHSIQTLLFLHTGQMDTCSRNFYNTKKRFCSNKREVANRRFCCQIKIGQYTMFSHKKGF